MPNTMLQSIKETVPVLCLLVTVVGTLMHGDLHALQDLYASDIHDSATKVCCWAPWPLAIRLLTAKADIH